MILGCTDCEVILCFSYWILTCIFSYCELSCLLAGDGYKDCCTVNEDTSEYTSNETSMLPSLEPRKEQTKGTISVPSSIPKVSQSETPSVEIITPPLVHPSIIPYSKPITSSILPISEVPPISCIFCKYNPTPKMISFGENCESSQYMLIISCSEDEWITNSYCELSCFLNKDDN